MRSTGDSAGAEAPLRIIAGPTGAGKSQLALGLAAARGATIISADSRQVYRGFDIGTAKPTSAERSLVRHEGVDVAPPTERWSAARWARAAAAWIDAAGEAGGPALVVGGTGLWLKALVTPLAEEPPLDPERRRAMQAALATLETAQLRSWVEVLDPPRAVFGRTQLLRAAEVALLSGTRLSEWHRAGAPRPRRPARWLIVDPGPVLNEAIARRVDAMFAAGWEDEVRALAASVPADAPAWNACGYEAIRDLVSGRLARVEARERILVATRQYAKRQRTWFRHQLKDEDVTKLDPRAPDAAEQAQLWFDGGSDA